MQPLEELLDRIKWDPEFGKGSFALGYYDRVADREIVVPLSAIAVGTGVAGVFSVQDAEGVTRTIPFHRVRVVYRNGEPIWRRPDPAVDRAGNRPG